MGHAVIGWWLRVQRTPQAEQRDQRVHAGADQPPIWESCRSQAQTIWPATPQRTARRRRIEPTPTIAPVIVWVVETGMPSAST